MMTRRVHGTSCQQHEHRLDPTEKSTMCLTCHIALVSFLCHGEVLERRHLTHTGDRDDD